MYWTTTVYVWVHAKRNPRGENTQIPSISYMWGQEYGESSLYGILYAF